MPRDYKHRTYTRRRTKRQPNVAPWKWLLAATLTGLFIAFLVFLANEDRAQKHTTKALRTPAPQKKENKRKAIPTKFVEPEFDFYTILPEQEVIIPEAEIKTRRREEKFGRAKPGHYVMQVGSFRKLYEADKLKAQLALLGIEANIESAKIGAAIWNRVKVGPYSSLSKIDSIRDRLRQNKIDAVVISAKVQ